MPNQNLAISRLVFELGRLDAFWTVYKNSAGKPSGDNEAQLQAFLDGMTAVRKQAAALAPSCRAGFLEATGNTADTLRDRHRDIAVAFARAAIAQGPVIPRAGTAPFNLSYQRAAEALLSVGDAIDDPETYDALGMDRSTFNANYVRQIAWAKTKGIAIGLSVK